MNQQLHDLRTNAGLSQTSLAIQAGLNPAVLNRVERGVRPSKQTAQKIAQALNVTPETLFRDYASYRAY